MVDSVSFLPWVATKLLQIKKVMKVKQTRANTKIRGRIEGEVDRAHERKERGGTD